MARRTIYVVLANRKTGQRLGVAALRTVATEVREGIPPRYVDRYRGDYVVAGTRFGVTPDDDLHTSVPCLKVRGEDAMRNLAVVLAARGRRVVAVAGYDRQLIGGRR